MVRSIFFGQTGITQTRKQFEVLLYSRISELDEKYRFTPDQKKKLELAGKRDIYRFFESTRETKAMLNRARKDRMQFLAILQGRQTLEIRMRSGEARFGDGSLFAKTLKTTLACEQYAEHSRDVFRGRVESVVSSLDERLGLSREQHLRFVTLIVEETPPLKRYGDYDAYAVMFQMSKLPEAQLKRILDEGQLRLLTDKFLEVRSYERVLKAQGYLAGDGPDVRQPAVVPGAKKDVDVRVERRLPRRTFTGQD